MQLQRSDLDVALAFVVERITQEAERSAPPLDDDEKHFLNHLPTKPTNPTAAAALGFNTAYEEFLPTPVLRDFRFERLCNLARDAHSRSSNLPGRRARMGICRRCSTTPAPSYVVATWMGGHKSGETAGAVGSFSSGGHSRFRSDPIYTWRFHSVRPY